jgi:hypothetical protein
VTDVVVFRGVVRQDAFVRRLVGLAALAACGTSVGGGGTVSIVLDIPNAALDPKGYSQVELRMHSASGDLERNVPVFNGAFDLGDLTPMKGTMLDAVLRNDTGEAVGYGRTSLAMDLVAGATLTVPVRRPIVYVAGQVYVDQDGNPQTHDWHWTTVPATFFDLSSGMVPDGSTTLGQTSVLMVDAGPNLYELQQGTSDPNGTLMGAATIVPVSTGDHSLAAPLSGTLMGGVLDGAGTDDGKFLIVGTTQHLYLVDTTTGMTKSLADGSYARVAIVGSDGSGLTAIAIKNRGDTTAACQPTAELDWVDVTSDEINSVTSLGTGGFSDVAGDRGHAYYVDACMGSLGEATAMGIQGRRTNLGMPTALAVSGAQAWIGVEKTGTPAQVSLLSASVTGSDPPRALFSEPATQVVNATRYPGVQRELNASTAVFNQLEVGAGGDYVAVTLASQYHGDAVFAANFPQMDVEAEELRVLDASSGASVERYRSWCDGVLLISTGDIPDWACATSSGESAPTNPMYEHKISSMTFLFGKK